MGNQLVGIAPSQIYPVEHYIQDLTDQHRVSLKYQASLGSTRFFKVARCESEAGPVVVKVFVIHDPSNDIKSFERRLKQLKDSLTPTFNCLPFSYALLTEKAGFIIRQYGKYSLYDRISTRPFLSDLEKRWLAFQLLLAVSQCHRLGVCHGDIKLENIIISSWSWLTLTDFASFKPTFLPEDNPADFSYFFDTSRRRVCYIAPERFISRTSVSESSSCQAELGQDKAEMVQSMDLFSVGCCIAELFTDGMTLFDFSQLLAYIGGEYQPEAVLDKIEDPAVRSLVEHMINKDPAHRLSAGEYLQRERGKVFPHNFYTFLQSYIGMFSRAPLMSSDQKIKRIYKDLSHFQSLLDSSDPSAGIDSGCLLVVTNVVISCVRSLLLTTTQLSCLHILDWLAARLSSEVILERLLPQIIHFISSPVPRVKMKAVTVLVFSLQHVSRVPRSDANTFPEYILPALSPLCLDPNVSVRCCLAKHLATIAQLATHWLDLVLSSPQPGQVSTDYHGEVSALHQQMVSLVTTLLEDNTNCVKQVLVTESAAQLAVWLGRQKANDVLLSHMITFLNDKEDSQLRLCFYENIAGVASFVGWHCSSILKPLLEQGLGDPEELVICRTITAMSDLVAQGLLEKVAIYDMLRLTTPFLLHPNLWMRQATAGLVAAVAGKLDRVDIQVKLASIVSPFLKQTLIQIESPHLLLAHCCDPLERPVLDQVVRCPDCPSLLLLLEERQTQRRLARMTPAQPPVYPEISPHLLPVFRRLAEARMTEEVEDKILYLREYIVKVSRFRSSAKEQEGVIDCGLIDAVKPYEKLKQDEPRRSEGGEEWPAGGERGETDGGETDQQVLLSPCQAQLSRFISEKRAEYSQVAARAERLDSLSATSFQSGWKPRGVLVAHLAEHGAQVSRLTQVPGHTLMASASTDGTLKVWDCAKMESGKNVANKARQTFSKNVPLDSLAATSHNHCLAVAARDGTVSVYNIEKQAVVDSRAVQLEEEGAPVDLTFCDLHSSPVLYYCTSFGSIIGWDLRKPGNAVRFSQDLRQGLTTALTVAGQETWLAAGTSSGLVSVWDLRFKLQVRCECCQHDPTNIVSRLPRSLTRVRRGCEGWAVLEPASLPCRCRETTRLECGAWRAAADRSPSPPRPRNTPSPPSPSSPRTESSRAGRTAS